MKIIGKLKNRVGIRDEAVLKDSAVLKDTVVLKEAVTLKRRFISKHNRIIAIVLIAALMITFLNGNTMIMDASVDDEYFAGNQLKQIGILIGYPDGTLKLEQPIIRSEVATIMVRVRGYEDVDINLAGKPFGDLAPTYWAYRNIQNAYKLNIIQGYPDNSFKPANNISYSEVVAIMVNTLGYKEILIGEWPTNYINKAKEIGVIPKTDFVDPNKIITRGEMALIVWDTLLVKISATSALN